MACYLGALGMRSWACGSRGCVGGRRSVLEMATIAPAKRDPRACELCGVCAIIVIMNALLGMGGAASVQMHVLLGALTASRVLHPFGMHARPMTLQFIVGRIVDCRPLGHNPLAACRSSSW